MVNPPDGNDDAHDACAGEEHSNVNSLAQAAVARSPHRFDIGASGGSSPHVCSNADGAKSAACGAQRDVDASGFRKRSRPEMVPVPETDGLWSNGSPGVGVNDLFPSEHVKKELC